MISGTGSQRREDSEALGAHRSVGKVESDFVPLASTASRRRSPNPVARVGGQDGIIIMIDWCDTVRLLRTATLATRPIASLSNIWFLRSTRK